MHNQKSIVINTGPIIALVAGLGDLSILKSLYKDVLVPFEVCSEILHGGSSSFAVNEFQDATWLNGLKLTGSIGILIRAKKEGFPIVMKDVIQRMKSHGIWLSEGVISFALDQVGEGNRSQRFLMVTDSETSIDHKH